MIEDHLQLLNIPLDNFEKKDSFWDPCDPCVFPPNSPEFIVGISLLSSTPVPVLDLKRTCGWWEGRKKLHDDA